MDSTQPSKTSAHIAVFHGAEQPIEFREWALPDTLNEGECLVEIRCATICGSDLHTIQGKRREPTPCILGHEGIGRVVALGRGRSTSWLGKRVTWSIADSCGLCKPCAEWELPQKCFQLFKYGHAPLGSGTGLNGTYASHVVLRRGTELVEIPSQVTDAMAAPANCALATMVAAIEGVPISRECAVIQGAGLLGLLGCALLKARGWKRVVLVDVNPDRLQLVREFGGEPALGSALDQVSVNTVDLVIEASGHRSTIAEGIQLLRPGGHYQLVGMVHPDSQLDLSGETLIRKCLTLRGTHNYAPKHLQLAVNFLATVGQSLPWDKTISPPFNLSEFAQALQVASSGRWARVAICPTDRSQIVT
jgi:putative phosphonate catabolism associated alcohol dehydrogenase